MASDPDPGGTTDLDDVRTSRSQTRRGRNWIVLGALTAMATILIVGGWQALRLGNTADGAFGVAAVPGVTEFAPGDRTDPADISGSTLAGEPLSVAAMRPDVVVLNVWGSWCAPCRKEAPGLAALSAEFATRNVKFVGINVKDNTPAARAFEQHYAITYPSINDADGHALLSLGSLVPSQAIPSTIVLDRQGRPAARVIGAVDASTLRALITSALGEAPGR